MQCETCHGPASIHVAKGGEEKPAAVRRNPPEDLCGCEHADPGGGQLERQRQVVEPAAQLDNRLV